MYISLDCEESVKMKKNLIEIQGIKRIEQHTQRVKILKSGSCFGASRRKDTSDQYTWKRKMSRRAYWKEVITKKCQRRQFWTICTDFVFLLSWLEIKIYLIGRQKIRWHDVTHTIDQPMTRELKGIIGLGVIKSFRQLFNILWHTSASVLLYFLVKWYKEIYLISVFLCLAFLCLQCILMFQQLCHFCSRNTISNLYRFSIFAAFSLSPQLPKN